MFNFFYYNIQKSFLSNTRAAGSSFLKQKDLLDAILSECFGDLPRKEKRRVVAARFKRDDRLPCHIGARRELFLGDTRFFP